LQKRGTIHFHAVFNITDEGEVIDSIYRYWGHSEINVQKVYDIVQLAVYMTKDFIKQDNNSPLFGKQHYTCSQHLAKPIVVKSWEMTQKGI